MRNKKSASTSCPPSVGEEFFDRSSSLFFCQQFYNLKIYILEGYIFPVSLDLLQLITLFTTFKPGPYPAIYLFPSCFWVPILAIMIFLASTQQFIHKGSDLLLPAKDKCPFAPLDCGVAVWCKSVQLSKILELLVAHGSTARPSCVTLWTPWWSLPCQSSYPGVQNLSLAQEVYWKAAFQIGTIWITLSFQVKNMITRTA